jgi:predicted GNAT family N-acyltransferase
MATCSRRSVASAAASADAFASPSLAPAVAHRVADRPVPGGPLYVGVVAEQQQIAIRWARDAEDVRGAFALREAVFIGEQEVPLEQEIDELDRDARQLVALDSAQVIGTLRLLSFGEEAKIGRVAVAKQWRRRGIASQMLDVALGRAREQGFERVRLAAQVVAVALYEQAGFAVESEPFEEAGITHVWMGLALGR